MLRPTHLKPALLLIGLSFPISVVGCNTSTNMLLIREPAQEIFVSQDLKDLLRSQSKALFDPNYFELEYLDYVESSADEDPAALRAHFRQQQHLRALTHNEELQTAEETPVGTFGFAVPWMLDFSPRTEMLELEAAPVGAAVLEFHKVSPRQIQVTGFVSESSLHALMTANLTSIPQQITLFPERPPKKGVGEFVLVGIPLSWLKSCTTKIDQGREFQLSLFLNPRAEDRVARLRTGPQVVLTSAEYKRGRGETILLYLPKNFSSAIRSDQSLKATLTEDHLSLTSQSSMNFLLVFPQYQPRDEPRKNTPPKIDGPQPLKDSWSSPVSP